MASISMTASLLCGSARVGPTPVSTHQRLVIVNAAQEGKKVKIEASQESNNGRRDLMFAAAAAAVCSAAGIALAGEPKPGSAEAKKAYAPVCVTMPTAKICRN